MVHFIFNLNIKQKMTIFIETHCVIQSDTHPLLVTTQFIFEIESYYKGIQGAMTVEDSFQEQVLSQC